jgi:membrane protein required for colicin V production
MTFSWLDGVILVVLVLSIVSAARRGFSREVIGLAAALLGLILGTWFYGTAGSWLTPYVSSADVSNFLGFLLVFMGTIVAGAILGVIVSRMLRTVGLSWIDRALGAAFGIARGLLVSVALVMILVAFAPGSSAAAPPRVVVNSRLAPYVIGTSRLLTELAPHELKDEFHRRYDQVKSAWDSRGHHA